MAQFSRPDDPNNYQLDRIADPTEDNQAATKRYVDNVVGTPDATVVEWDQGGEQRYGYLAGGIDLRDVLTASGSSFAPGGSLNGTLPGGNEPIVIVENQLYFFNLYSMAIFATADDTTNRGMSDTEVDFTIIHVAGSPNDIADRNAERMANILDAVPLTMYRVEDLDLLNDVPGNVPTAAGDYVLRRAVDDADPMWIAPTSTVDFVDLGGTVQAQIDGSELEVVQRGDATQHARVVAESLELSPNTPTGNATIQAVRAGNNPYIHHDDNNTVNEWQLSHDGTAAASRILTESDLDLEQYRLTVGRSVIFEQHVSGDERELVGHILDPVTRVDRVDGTVTQVSFDSPNGTVTVVLPADSVLNPVDIGVRDRWIMRASGHSSNLILSVRSLGGTGNRTIVFDKVYYSDNNSDQVQTRRLGQNTGGETIALFDDFINSEYFQIAELDVVEAVPTLPYASLGYTLSSIGPVASTVGRINFRDGGATPDVGNTPATIGGINVVYANGEGDDDYNTELSNIIVGTTFRYQQSVHFIDFRVTAVSVDSGVYRFEVDVLNSSTNDTGHMHLDGRIQPASINFVYSGDPAGSITPPSNPFNGYTIQGTASTTNAVPKWVGDNTLQWSPDTGGTGGGTGVTFRRRTRFADTFSDSGITFAGGSGVARQLQNGIVLISSNNADTALTPGVQYPGRVVIRGIGYNFTVESAAGNSTTVLISNYPLPTPLTLPSNDVLNIRQQIPEADVAVTRIAQTDGVTYSDDNGGQLVIDIPDNTDYAETDLQNIDEDLTLTERRTVRDRIGAVNIHHEGDPDGWLRGDIVGSTFMHGAVTNSTRIVFTFMFSVEPVQVKTSLFLPGQTAISTVAETDPDNISVITSTEINPDNDLQLIVTLDSPITLPASDDDSSNFRTWSLQDESVAIIGGDGALYDSNTHTITVPDGRTLVNGIDVQYSIPADIFRDLNVRSGYTYPRTSDTWVVEFATGTEGNRFAHGTIFPVGASGIAIGPTGLTGDDIEAGITDSAIIREKNQQSNLAQVEIVFEEPLTITADPNVAANNLRLYAVTESRVELRVLEPGAGVEFTDIDDNGTVVVTAHAAAESGASDLADLQDVHLPANFEGATPSAALLEIFRDHNHHDRSFFWDTTNSITFNFINLEAADITALTQLDPSNGQHHLQLTYPAVGGETQVEIKINRAVATTVGTGSVRNAVNISGVITRGEAILDDSANSSVPSPDFPAYHEINDQQLDNITAIHFTVDVGHTDGDLLNWNSEDEHWEVIAPNDLPTKLNILLGMPGEVQTAPPIGRLDSFTRQSFNVGGVNWWFFPDLRYFPEESDMLDTVQEVTTNRGMFSSNSNPYTTTATRFNLIG